jgi:hypothetical protein
VIRIRPNDRSLTRVSPSYYKQKLTSGSNYSKDNFGYV